MNQWPFTVETDGNDLVVSDCIITAFGGWGAGIADPNDDGETASGVNTATKVVHGVSVPMNGLDFSTLKPDEHRALDGCPIPRLLNRYGLTAWHTLVEVTIGDIIWTPPDGIVDLGPGFHAGEPRALDLTVLSASHFEPAMLLRKIAEDFEVRGSYRIIGGALLNR